MSLWDDLPAERKHRARISMARWLVEYADRYATPEGFYEELLEERRKESKKLPCPVCGWRNCGTYDLWLDQREHSLF